MVSFDSGCGSCYTNYRFCPQWEIDPTDTLYVLVSVEQQLNALEEREPDVNSLRDLAEQLEADPATATGRHLDCVAGLSLRRQGLTRQARPLEMFMFPHTQLT